MTIQVTQLPDAEPSRDRHVAIGTFDGVHLGHQAVIDDADTVLTFEPHPLTVIHPEAAPKLIMPFKLKRDVIDGHASAEAAHERFAAEHHVVGVANHPDLPCEPHTSSKLGARWTTVAVAPGSNTPPASRCELGPAPLGRSSALRHPRCTVTGERHPHLPATAR